MKTNLRTLGPNEAKTVERELAAAQAEVARLKTPEVLHAHCLRYMTEAQIAHLFGERMTAIVNAHAATLAKLERAANDFATIEKALNGESSDALCKLAMKAATLHADWSLSVSEVISVSAKLTAAEQQVEELKQDVKRAHDAGNGLYEAILASVSPYFEAGSRDLDWDVLPSGLAGKLAELTRERDELAAWKQSALAVEASWDCQSVARWLQLPPGSDIRKSIEPAIVALAEQLAAARRDGERLDWLFQFPSALPIKGRNDEWQCAKYIGHVIGRGPTQRAAIDDAMQPTDAKNQR